MKFRLLFIPMITCCISACFSSKELQELKQQNKDLSYSYYQSRLKLMDDKVVHRKAMTVKNNTISALQDSCAQLQFLSDSLQGNIDRLEQFLFVTRIKKRRDSIRLVDQINTLTNTYGPYQEQKNTEKRIKDSLQIIKQALFLSLQGTSYTPIEQTDSLGIMIRYLSTPFFAANSPSTRAKKAMDSLNHYLMLHPFFNLDVHLHCAQANEERTNWNRSNQWALSIYSAMTNFTKNTSRVRMIPHGSSMPLNTELPKALINSRIDFQLWVDPTFFTSDK